VIWDRGRQRSRHASLHDRPVDPMTLKARGLGRRSWCRADTACVPRRAIATRRARHPHRDDSQRSRCGSGASAALAQDVWAAGCCLFAHRVHAAEAGTSRLAVARLPWFCTAVGARDKQTGMRHGDERRLGRGAMGRWRGLLVHDIRDGTAAPEAAVIGLRLSGEGSSRRQDSDT
jgi:hypothetical protein